MTMASRSQGDFGGFGGGGGTQAASATQDEVVSSTQYADYDADALSFTNFVLGHMIRVTKPRRRGGRVVANDEDEDDDEDDDDEMLEEPTALDGTGVTSQPQRRVPCYPPLLQCIKDNDRFPNRRQFIVEVPLSELQEWDSTNGHDLATRAANNTLRYHALFCAVIDELLENNFQRSTNVTGGRRGGSGNFLWDAQDILREQRIAIHRNAQQQRQQQQQQAANQAGGAGADGVFGEGGGVAGDAALNGTAATTAAGPGGTGTATMGLPPLLHRQYELRILPVGRRGKYFPFRYKPNDLDEGDADDDGDEGSSYVHDSRYQEQIVPSRTLTLPKETSLRYVRSRSMGHLVTIRGMVVRSSDVKPFIQVATYSCDVCGSEVYDLTYNKREFVPLKLCMYCAQSGGGTGNANDNNTQQQGPRRRAADMGILQLQTKASKFTKFQELKMQELPSQVPMGHVPRSLTVYCRGELTRQANPGDDITIDGIFLPQKVNDGHGYRGRRAGLMSTLYVDAQNIIVHKKSYDAESSTTLHLPEAERQSLEDAIRRVSETDDPAGILAKAIAPEIFGHEDIKRALLLQLVGGVFRQMSDGMKIRGDINICLMGDPGVAKSQLLKHVASVAPRGVYTTGKGSSGVGLTAAITKDSMTGELALEGGALVLADQGICAIDEFDKMDENDRTAIHEVMEQQTVSIAKAGIVATLNARASVLAAANPLYSRYNRHKSLSENINLPNSLLSRFDLMFLILDTPDVDRDTALARHVTFVHQNEGLEEKQDKQDSDDDDDDSNDGIKEIDYDEEKGTVSSRLLREYISKARRYNPFVTPEVAPYIVEAYVSLRMEDRPYGLKGTKRTSGDQTAMTARQLLSILRLSQAHARIRFSSSVGREDVDEAIRLTHMSKASLNDEAVDGSGKTQQRREDFMTRIFNIIRDYATTSNSSTVDMNLAEAMAIRKGFTAQQLELCLEEYSALEVIQINQNRTQIHFTA